MATRTSDDNESFGGVNPLARFHGTERDGSVDDFYETLSSQRRRELLYVLQSVDAATVELSELASIVAAWEQDIDDPGAVTYDDRKSIQTAISQHHVPKLADAGLVDYDEDTNELALAVDPASLRLPDLSVDSPAANGGSGAGGSVEADDSAGTGNGSAVGGGVAERNGSVADGEQAAGDGSAAAAGDGIEVSHRVTTAVAGVFAAVGVTMGARAPDAWPLLVASSAAAGALLVVAYGDWRSTD